MRQIKALSSLKTMLNQVLDVRLMALKFAALWSYGNELGRRPGVILPETKMPNGKQRILANTALDIDTF